MLCVRASKCSAFRNAATYTDNTKNDGHEMAVRIGNYVNDGWLSLLQGFKGFFEC